MTNPKILRQIDDIVKSPEDKRQYRGLELTNKLKILVISDPTTDKSSAAMDVNIGCCYSVSSSFTDYQAILL